MLNWISKFIEIDKNLKKGNWFGSFLFGHDIMNYMEKLLVSLGMEKLEKKFGKDVKVLE